MRVKSDTRPLARRSRINIPPARHIDRGDGDLCLRERTDNRREGLADLAAKREAEDGIDDVVGGGEGGGKVCGEGDV